MLSRTACPTRWCGDGEQFQVVLFEQVAFAGAVGVVGQGLVDLEVVSPAGEFQAVVTKLGCLLAEGFERQVGPLAGEESDRSSHGRCLQRSAALVFLGCQRMRVGWITVPSVIDSNFASQVK